MTMVVGVMHSVDADGAEFLALCNGVNQWESFTCVAFSGGTGADVLLKIALPPQVYVNIPQFLKAIVVDIAQTVPGIRQIFNSKGISGIPHTYCESDIKRILNQIHS
ncbi:MAG: hypothetical protein ABSB09_04300 [Acidimicrobiales bacterium]